MNGYALLLLVPLFIGCSQKKESKGVAVNWSKEKSMNLNKVIAAEEKVNIQLFLEGRKSWKMTETGSGLQYFIYEKGEGAQPEIGSVVDVAFSISLLDGTLCYKTEEDEVVEIVVDHSEVETGVQEGLKKMKVGDKAKMIIPSHLAHGLTGDLDKIKPLSPLVVDIHLIEIVK
jgi:FKBP-type peptidyl-prolyl cis-trans isomerase FkpA